MMNGPDTETLGKITMVSVLDRLKEAEPKLEQYAGRHRQNIDRRHIQWYRFLVFGGIGLFVFLAGTTLQWVLLKPLGTEVSYIWQTVFSVELSYALNRWLTWHDRDTPVVSSLVKWNIQKLVLTVPNIIAYDLLLRTGMNWLTANFAATALFTVVNYAVADKWSFTRSDRKWRFHRPAFHRYRTVLLLLAILSVQAGLSMRLIWRNTAFADEALYLWAGRLEWAHWLHGMPLPAYPFPVYFSGAPVVYPPIGALANDVGGLAGARLLSMCFMLGATILLYSVTCRLFGDCRAALVAAAAFAFLGPTQFLGALATYDAMAVFLLALAAWFAIRSSGSYWGELALIVCVLLLVAADAAKYASLLWNPVVIALVILGPANTTRRASLWRASRLVFYGVMVILPLLFLVGGHSYITGIMFTTLSRQLPGVYSPHLVLDAAFNWIGIVFILALLGFALSLSTGDKRIRWLCGILTVAALLAPVNQARIDTLTSLQKHVVFGAWFASIAAGYVMIGMSRADSRKGWRVPVVALTAILAFSIPQADGLFGAWPNTSDMTHELSTVLKGTKCPCLITENSVASYYLSNQMAGAVPISTYGFSYYDITTRQELSGLPAYQLAIKANYFGVIELDDTGDIPVFTAIARTLVSSHNYTLVATLPASGQKNPFRIWVRK